MNEHTDATITSAPSIATARLDGDPLPPSHLIYEMVASGWTRQARAFVRSLHAYQHVTRLRDRRISRASHDPVEDAPAGAVAAPPPDIGAAAPPQAPAPSAAPGRPLTRRQFEIAALIAQGLSNDEIAQRLVLTPGTVGNHVGHILRRLGARNRAQIASWFVQTAAPPPASRDDRRA